MKLYNLDHSPYSTRVRMQVRYKSLPVEILPPPIALRTPEFMARFAMGKVPVLELDDGTLISESTVIMDYLEDVFVQQPMRPADPLARAQMGMLSRYADTHMGPAALFPIFKAAMAPAGVDWQPHIDALGVELARLQRLLSSLPNCHTRGLHLGDVALVPTMLYVLAMTPMLGVSDVLADYPAVAEWWQWVKAFDVVADTSDEMIAAYKAFMAAQAG